MGCQIDHEAPGLDAGAHDASTKDDEDASGTAAVTYMNDGVSALDLRFEQHCEGGSAALHGKVHVEP